MEKIMIPVVVRPFGSHCHERVFQAMELLGSGSKRALADCASTTIAVVSNAIHDWKNGLYVPEKGRSVLCSKVRVGNEWVYSFDKPEEAE